MIARAALLMPVLAYRPFLDPMPIDSYWPFVPLVIGIALVYKTIKIEDMRFLPREAGRLALLMFAYMGLGAAALWLLIELV